MNVVLDENFFVGYQIWTQHIYLTNFDSWEPEPHLRRIWTNLLQKRVRYSYSVTNQGIFSLSVNTIKYDCDLTSTFLWHSQVINTTYKQQHTHKRLQWTSYNYLALILGQTRHFFWACTSLGFLGSICLKINIGDRVDRRWRNVFSRI